jgi:hypothetical protein
MHHAPPPPTLIFCPPSEPPPLPPRSYIQLPLRARERPSKKGNKHTMRGPELLKKKKKTLCLASFLFPSRRRRRRRLIQFVCGGPAHHPSRTNMSSHLGTKTKKGGESCRCKLLAAASSFSTHFRTHLTFSYSLFLCQSVLTHAHCFYTHT